MKTQREFGEAENILRMANSAQMVLPLPVGAPTNTSSSVLYKALNTGERQVRKSERGRERVMRGERGGRVMYEYLLVSLNSNLASGWG